MSAPEHYACRVHWSVEDDAYVGTVAELPSLSWLDDGRSEAFAGIQRLVDDVVADMAADGEEAHVGDQVRHKCTLRTRVKG